MYRKHLRMYSIQYYSWFQASTGNLGTHSPWIWGANYCIGKFGMLFPSLPTVIFLCSMWNQEGKCVHFMCICVYWLNLLKQAAIPFLIKKRGRVYLNLHKRKKASPMKFLEVEAGLGVWEPP